MAGSSRGGASRVTRRLGRSQVKRFESGADLWLRTALSYARTFAQRYRGRILSAASLGFALGLVLAIKSPAISWHDAEGIPLLLIAIAGVPMAVALKSAEFGLCGASVGRRPSFLRGVVVTSAGTVANLLPVPGALAVRGAAMVDAGAGLRETGGILVLASMLWLAMGVAVMGAALLQAQHAAAWSLLLSGGVASVITIGWIGMRSTFAMALGFIAVRAGLLAVMLFRIWLAFLAIGTAIPPTESAYYILAGIAGSVVTIVPAGLGISEGAAALIAMSTGGMPSAAFVALALNRMVGIAVNGAVVLLAGVLQRRQARG